MKKRVSNIDRRTKETEISVSIDIDGNGEYDIKCDYFFIKHMIETMSRFSSVDIFLTAKGNENSHLAEEIGLTLGMAFKDALKDVAIERIATKTVVMDDAMVTVSIDIADRPYAEIDCPDSLCHNFLSSFAMSSDMALHVLVVRGFDNHHIVESSFKALGKCLKDAVVNRETELSTKDKIYLET
jgi:imidazoleglycerol-phosphate dehydratase